MSRIRLPISLPRATNFARFLEEPLDFLARARSIHGNLFALREGKPVFSRAPDCAGVVAVFGPELQRAVLSDIESFGMPASAAQHLKLSQKLINLNRGLHSMPVVEHAAQKPFLAGVARSSESEVNHEQVRSALDSFTKDWAEGSEMGLLDQMRQLMLQASSRLLFGDRSMDSSGLVLLLQKYFNLRREASSPGNPADPESRGELVAVGNSLDAELRSYVRKCRQGPDDSSGGILAKLATLEPQPGRRLSEDEVVGHSNVFFVSSTEPMAVALTWILLILSQLPALRGKLRSEMREVLGTSSWPAFDQLGRLRMLDRVINESLRLLPPNVFMVRLTTQPAVLNDLRLPARCEIILCPFLAHRDSEIFPQPDDFWPDRWKAATPSAFEYFPFGAGGHSCVGKNMATRLIKTVLAFLLPRYDLILAGDQEIDWRVHIMFMPRCDPIVTIQSLDAPVHRRAGHLGGPVGKLLNLGTHES